MSKVEATATLNQKEQPNTLTVAGTLFTPYGGDTVHLEEVLPPGINPSILQLKAIVNAVPGPMKMTAKTFVYTHTDNAAIIKQVIIRHEKDETPVEVTIHG